MSTLFIGQNKVFLPETDSTNSYAISVLKNVNTIEGTVVYTDKQTNGKGQRGNVWMSEHSMNITLSLILKPLFLSPQKIFYISKITALAIHDLLTETLINGQFDIKIKWPNDILVNKKKIAGVLIENSFSDNKINWSVVGVGINTNQTKFEGLNSATSIKLQVNRDFETSILMEAFFKHFENWYLKLKNEKYALIDENYHKVLYGMNTNLDFMINNELCNNKILGVNEAGLLRLLNQNNDEKQYDIKEVGFIL